MKLSIVFAVIAAIAAPALAAPAAEAAAEARSDLQKREFSVYVCEHENFQPRCVTVFPPFNVCQPFSATGLTGFQAFGPSQGTICLWYTGPNCTGTQSDYIQYPGFSTVPAFWQFNTASWKCFT
ncbi:hypothetical protein Hypma_016452 [Hypsizygus marmoreus]|uniref:Uncharacterized protein n=1 Tax=Hypsizygus marmoreus TaxID=39966 RepID=A0A369J0C2_HYPMA|nr:hypothetical protein Hypma_016452 [Hypsizygus marmoreus]